MPPHAVEQLAQVLDLRRDDDACMPAACGFPHLVQMQEVHFIESQERPPVLRRVGKLGFVRDCLPALEAQLSQDSSNASRPPSSDPRYVPPKRRPKPSG